MSITTTVPDATRRVDTPNATCNTNHDVSAQLARAEVALTNERNENVNLRRQLIEVLEERRQKHQAIMAVLHRADHGTFDTVAALTHHLYVVMGYDRGGVA